MTTETILTDEQVRNIIEGVAWPNEEVFKFTVEVARAIEQAVLRSPEVQALRRDAERYRCLRDIADPSDWDYIGQQSPDVIDTEVDELLRQQM